ncbi:MAG: hypothetical protein N3D81_03830 [Spirochaetes bacterium]|nr:hypothetical protein [Spirochaetota bacterium]
MIFFLKSIKRIYREIERIIGEDHYRGRKKKRKDVLIMLISHFKKSGVRCLEVRDEEVE